MNCGSFPRLSDCGSSSRQPFWALGQLRLDLRPREGNFWMTRTPLLAHLAIIEPEGRTQKGEVGESGKR